MNEDSRDNLFIYSFNFYNLIKITCCTGKKNVIICEKKMKCLKSCCKMKEGFPIS